MILRKFFPKTLFAWTLFAVFMGIFVGLFFGDYCFILKPAGVIYVSLMQVVLYPYIICALISALGKLSPHRGYELLKRGWLIFALFLFICFVLISTLATAIPHTIGLGTQSEAPVPVNIIGLLLSNNVFAALSQSQVPAVIIFCIILAIMLQRMKGTESLFQIMDIVSNACLEFWRVLVKVAPFFIFAIIAFFVGTIKFSQLTEASLFLFLFYAGTFMLAFWILPALIVNLVPINYKTLLSQLRDALLIAATTSTVLAIPYIQNMAYNFFKKNDEKENTEIYEVVETNLIVSYAFAIAGPYFVALFIIFASLYFNHPLEEFEKMWLPVVTYFASLGGHLAAVIYLIDWLRLPKESTTTLYMSIFPAMQFNMNFANAMSMAFFTLVATAVYFGRMRIRKILIVVNLVLAALVLIIIVQVKHWIPDPNLVAYNRLMNSSLDPELTAGVKVKFLPPLTEASLVVKQHPEDALFRIQKTNVLRVGYNSALSPFSFFNTQKELVGFDVAYVFGLAKTLHANIEFIPYTSQYLLSYLRADVFDIAIGGLIATEGGLPFISFSDPYLKSSIAFIVPRREQRRFENVDNIERIPNLRIGVIGGPTVISTIQSHFPNATVVSLPDSITAYDDAFKEHKVDTIFWSRVRANPWVLARPHYVAVSPSGISAPLLMAYMVQKQSIQFLAFLNYWLKLKESDGFFKHNYEQWILIHPVPDTEPRWSILRNVLHLRL